jgi:hypothetical protein
MRRSDVAVALVSAFSQPSLITTTICVVASAPKPVSMWPLHNNSDGLSRKALSFKETGQGSFLPRFLGATCSLAGRSFLALQTDLRTFLGSPPCIFVEGELYNTHSNRASRVLAGVARS